MTVTTASAATAASTTTSTTNTASTSTSGTTSTTSSDTTGTLSPDFETFLKMLTTQMKNQDPLNPMDSKDFAVQLATFSGVEQQMKTNQLLDGLSAQMGAMGMAQLAGWVGMQARTTEPVWFGGTPLTLDITPETGADRAVLVVRDDAGNVIQRTDTPLTGGEISWAGTDKTGAPLTSGQYSFTLESYRGGTVSTTSPVPAYGKITEARVGDNGPVLVLEGGAEVPSTEISALRDPG